LSLERKIGFIDLNPFLKARLQKEIMELRPSSIAPTKIIIPKEA
jgi:hypothetical protein